MYFRCLFMGLLWGLASSAHTAMGQVREQDEAEAVRSSENAASESEVVDKPRIAESIVERTNRFRRNKDRQPVETNAELTETARYFAGYMARTNRYGHNADGQRPSQRASQHDYDYCIVSENIAYQYSSAGFESKQLVERFMEGWKTSPGHRKNMLDTDVTETGVAVAQSKETGYIYAVQMFGRPKSARIAFEVANQSDETVQYEIGDRSFPLPPRYVRTHQRCRPSELTFTWQAQGEKRSRTFEPKADGRFVVKGQGDEVRIERASTKEVNGAAGRN